MRLVKSFGLVVLLILCSQSIQAQSLKKLINQVRDDAAVFSCNLPGWSIRMVKNLTDDETEPEDQIIEELFSSIKRLKLVVADHSPQQKELVAKIYHKLEKDENYNLLAEGMSDGHAVRLWVDQTNDDIRHIFFTVKSDSDKLVLALLKSKLKLSDLKGMDFYQKLKA